MWKKTMEEQGGKHNKEDKEERQEDVRPQFLFSARAIDRCTARVTSLSAPLHRDSWE